MSAEHPRLCLLPLRQALPWRWELAQLELACREAWRTPEPQIWSARANQLGLAMAKDHGSVALAFEGYTVVGAMWCQDGGTDDAHVFGPYCLPQYARAGLESRLRALLVALQQ